MRSTTPLFTLLLTTPIHISASSLSDPQCNTVELDTTPLTCRHHGICKVGTKTIDPIFPSGIHSIFSPTSEHGMYCDCNEDTSPNAEGHTGLKCEESYTICPDTNVCFHGAECNRDSHDYNLYHCNCPTTDTFGEIFAGVHCEAKATNFCDKVGSDTNDDDDDHDVNNGIWFCTNGGECLKDETDLTKKCDCKEGNFGLHCELESDEECNLNCANNGVCKFGIKDFSDFSGSKLDIDNFFGGGNQRGMHCVCPAGFTGIQCEQETQICGDGVCFHGATCVAHYEDDDADPSFSCDCDIHTQENPFAGIYCEHESTTYCPAQLGQDPKSYFCTNGGHCPPPNRPYEHCACPPNYSGPRCEFRVEDNQECDLNCNAGNCFFGTVGNPDESILDSMDVTIPTEQFYSAENMHCKCPDGYDGEFCEHKIEVCGDNEHVCLNDSKCIPDGDEFICDCEAASNQLEAFAGTYCEMVADTFCIGHGDTTHSFCTNNGKCKGEVVEGDGKTHKSLNSHVGCDCVEGFKGEFCEIIDSQYKSTNGTAGRFVGGFLIAISLVILLGVGGKYAYKRRQSKREYREQAPQEEVEEEEDPNYWDPLGTKLRNSSKYGKGKRYENYEPYRDENEGNNKDEDDEEYEMQNVEII